jgi:hypothetical protein
MSRAPKDSTKLHNAQRCSQDKTAEQRTAQ